MAVSSCGRKILSNDYVDWVIDFPLTEALQSFTEPDSDYCYTPIDGNLGLVSVERSQASDISLLSIDVQYLPELYGLQEIQELQASQNTGMFNIQPLENLGALSVQREPLNLTGRGVIIGIADTGIDYTNPVFRKPDGTTRIVAIWDQTIQEGEAPPEFGYGSVYTKEQINEALMSDNPRAIVPTTDDIGHGSRMASVAGGSQIDGGIIFTSPAYDCEFVIVKLKQCKDYLREYFLISADVPAYQSSDIMMAVKYIDSFANTFFSPVVFCLGLGSSFGDHIGNTLLSRYLADVAYRRSRVMLLAGGNEGNAAHHYSGRLSERNIAGEIVNSSRDMEIRVGENQEGFLLQIWSSAPASLSISIRTPNGETVPRTTALFQRNLQYSFVYAKTIITVDYALIETGSGDVFILMRFQNPSAGIWTVTITNDTEMENTVFHAWLPISPFLSAPTYFLEPDPNITLTIPSYSENAITLSTYDSNNNSFYVDSGRGFSRSNVIKPDVSSPGVSISTVSNTLAGNPVVSQATGASLACALAAGAAAQFMQWAVIDGNSIYVRSIEVKNYFIRGAIREPSIVYPSRQWGFGRLNIQNVFDILVR